jgi:hypothetical protein
MTVIDDLEAAVSAYATNNCKTEIVARGLDPGAGSVLNVGETFRFRVRIENQGPLDMKNVTVTARATEFANVARSNEQQFSDLATSNPFDLDAQQIHHVDFRGKATKVTGAAEKDIVTAQISAWNGSLDHILVDQSVQGASEGKLKLKVHEN